MKKHINAQKKGRAFEKEISKNLSLWWSNNKRDDIFFCTSGSGSRFTSRKKVGKDTANSCGDIGITDPIGQPLLDFFSIEVKRGYSDKLDILSLVDSKNKNNEVIDWVVKAKKEIKEAGRPYYMIVIKRNRKQKVVVIDIDFYYNFLSKIKPSKEPLLKFYGEVCFVIIPYDEFFSIFSPLDFIKEKGDQ